MSLHRRVAIISLWRRADGMVRRYTIIVANNSGSMSVVHFRLPTTGKLNVGRGVEAAMS